MTTTTAVEITTEEQQTIMQAARFIEEVIVSLPIARHALPLDLLTELYRIADKK